MTALGAAVAMGGLPIAVAASHSPGTTSSLPDLIELQSGNSTYRTDILRFSERQGWWVDGGDSLFSDLYFLNFGNDLAQRELRLEDFEFLSFSQPSADRFTADFFLLGANLNFSLTSSLQGFESGSFRAVRQETVTLLNSSSDPIDITLFKYLDLDLGGKFDNDSVLFADNVLTQFDPSGAIATLSVDQTPTAVAMDEYPILLQKFYNRNRTNLSPGNDSLSNTDVSVALQFDRSLVPGESISFNFVKQISRRSESKSVPEPTAFLAFGVVVAGLMLMRRS
ncbi:MAG: PEP-CTERM sorting domain-containing protein [Leptolyngbya sp. LCM1.Bin17]|nr:MAG: PEP-CTERM sorting domain-containing protein [Leptolyngbya sp. LCM1.Bin17]